MKKLLLIILLLVFLTACNALDEKEEQLNNIEKSISEKNQKQETETSTRENNVESNQENIILQENNTNTNKDNNTDIGVNPPIKIDYEIDPKYGNTPGNLNNLGYAATDGEWIYFYKDYYDYQGQRTDARIKIGQPK